MRDLFPIARRYAYLDHAAIAPLATPVRSAMTVFLDRLLEEPFEPAHWERLRTQVRTRVGELLSVGPEGITFTRNTTAGLGLVAAGLDWRQGDNIVGVDREFPANIYPWMGLKSRGVDLRLHRPENGRIDVKALLGLCDSRTPGAGDQRGAILERIPGRPGGAQQGTAGPRGPPGRRRACRRSAR